MLKKTLLLALLIISSTAAIAQIKTVSILGDSYSTYEGYVEPDTNYVWYHRIPNTKTTNVSSVKHTWWHLFLKEMGYRLCVNNSFSGSTICNTGYNKEDYSDRSFITRMNKLGSPDIIYIFGATNDSWAKSPIGEYKYADWTKEDLYQFRPAMAYMLDYMTKRYLNTEIYFILNTKLKAEVNESVYTICKHYGVDVITLNDMKRQHGHPNIEGMRSIADQVKAYMKKK